MILTDFNDEELIQNRIKIRDIACDIELEEDVVISPIVRNIDKYNERVDIIPFYINVQKKGWLYVDNKITVSAFALYRIVIMMMNLNQQI